MRDVTAEFSEKLSVFKSDSWKVRSAKPRTGKGTAKILWETKRILRVTLEFCSVHLGVQELHSEFSDKLVKKMLFELLEIVQITPDLLKKN